MTPPTPQSPARTRDRRSPRWVAVAIGLCVVGVAAAAQATPPTEWTKAEREAAILAREPSLGVKAAFVPLTARAPVLAKALEALEGGDRAATDAARDALTAALSTTPGDGDGRHWTADPWVRGLAEVTLAELTARAGRVDDAVDALWRIVRAGAVDDDGVARDGQPEARAPHHDRAARVLRRLHTNQGQPGLAGLAGLSVAPGAPDSVAAWIEGAERLGKGRAPDSGTEAERRAAAAGVAAEALERQLLLGLTRSDRLALTEAAAARFVDAGRLADAQRLWLRLWWRERDAGRRDALRAELDALGAKDEALAVGFGTGVAREVLTVRRRGAEKLHKALKRRRARGRYQKRVLAWGRAVLARFGDEGDVKAALKAIRPLDAPLRKAGLGVYLDTARAELLRRLDRDEEAIASYIAAADAAPGHPLAVEALVEAAGIEAWIGRPTRATALYARASRMAERGVAHREALWETGFRAAVDGDGDVARGALGALVGRYGGGRDGYGVTWHERGGYWLARLDEDGGDAAAAREAFERLRWRFPLSWYGRLSGDRLAGLEAPPSDAQGPTVRDDWARALDGVRVALARGDEAGARDWAQRLHDTERLPGRGRSLLAELWRREGTAWRVSSVLRHGAVMAETPGRDVGAHAVYGKAYALSHGDAVREYAKANDLEPALLAALVHIESRFRSDVVSGRGAVGLCQLLPETARIIGRRLLDEKVQRRDLKRPETNLRVGARFLRELLSHFQGHRALALAGYNAGRGAARTWLRRRGHLPVDRFVELIPYPQARRYVMRVVAVADVYRALHGVGGPSPALAWEMPLTLGPYMVADRGEGEAASEEEAPRIRRVER